MRAKYRGPPSAPICFSVSSRCRKPSRNRFLHLARHPAIGRNRTFPYNEFQPSDFSSAALHSGRNQGFLRDFLEVSIPVDLCEGKRDIERILLRGERRREPGLSVTGLLNLYRHNASSSYHPNRLDPIMDKCVLFRRAFTDPENGCYCFLELRHRTRITAYLWIVKRPR